MKIAFVWKWWSGKSTISALFTKHLFQKNLPVIWFDADININYFQNMNIEIKPELALSNSENMKQIRNFLIWENEKIKSPAYFVKTTPPGSWSNFLEYRKDNFIIKNFAQQVQGNYFMYIGTYNDDWIWTSCYHNHLSIFENVLSHTKLQQKEYLVADMSAGTDAFSNTLHAQFHKIVLIINPSSESIKVANDFIRLANKAWTSENINIIINNFEDPQEAEVIEQSIWIKATAYLKKNKKIQQKSLLWEEINIADTNYQEEFDKILNSPAKYKEDDIYQNLRNLHLKYANQDHVIKKVGDISLQAKT